MSELTQKMRNIFLLLCISLAMPIETHAASFDCGQARLGVDKTICEDSTLSRMDEAINTAYARVRDIDKSEAVVARQRDWLRERNSCKKEKDNRCLLFRYKNRLQELSTTPGYFDSGVNDLPITTQTEAALLFNQIAVLQGIAKKGQFFEQNKEARFTENEISRCEDLKNTLLNTQEIPKANFSTGKDGNTKILDVLQTHFLFLRQGVPTKNDLEKRAQINWAPVRDLLLREKVLSGLKIDAFLFHFPNAVREYVLQWYLVKPNAPQQAIYAGRIEFDDQGSPMIFAFYDEQLQQKSLNRFEFPVSLVRDWNDFFVMAPIQIVQQTYFMDLIGSSASPYDSRISLITDTASYGAMEHKDTHQEHWNVLAIYSPEDSEAYSSKERDVKLHKKLWPSHDIGDKPKHIGDLGVYNQLQGNVDEALLGWRQPFNPDHYFCNFGFSYPLQIITKGQ